MKSLLTFFFLLLASLAFSQEESFPCESANAELYSLFTTGKLSGLYVHACSGEGMNALSTSFLKPAGSPPEVKQTGIDEPPDDAAYVEWTCRYTAGKLQDDDPKTAWVEGKEGNGLTEIVIVPCLDLKQPVEIWAGFGKSESLFIGNNRPKIIRVAVIETTLPDPTQYGTYYGDLTIVAQHDITLKDLNGYQPLAIPAFEVKTYFNKMLDQEVDATYFLGIQLVSVYQGTRWKDTCISEVRNVSN